MDLNNGVNFDLKQFITSDEGEAVDDAIESELYFMIKKMKKNGTTRAQLEYRHYETLFRDQSCDIATVALNLAYGRDNAPGDVKLNINPGMRLGNVIRMLSEKLNLRVSSLMVNGTIIVDNDKTLAECSYKPGTIIYYDLKAASKKTKHRLDQLAKHRRDPASQLN